MSVDSPSREDSSQSRKKRIREVSFVYKHLISIVEIVSIRQYYYIHR